MTSGKATTTAHSTVTTSAASSFSRRRSRIGSALTQRTGHATMTIATNGKSTSRSRESPTTRVEHASQQRHRTVVDTGGLPAVSAVSCAPLGISTRNVAAVTLLVRHNGHALPSGHGAGTATVADDASAEATVVRLRHFGQRSESSPSKLASQLVQRRCTAGAYQCFGAGWGQPAFASGRVHAKGRSGASSVACVMRLA